MLDKYKDKDNLSVNYNVAKYLGLKTVTQYKLSKATFNIDGSKRGYTAFREENNNG